MRFTIDHTIDYHYSRAVFLEPHTFRLRPRVDGGQFVEHHTLRIQPAPTGVTQTLDAYGNVIARAWFSDTTETLKIEAHSVVVTERRNPFDYILDADNLTLPPVYGPAERHRLDHPLTRLPHPGGADDRVAAFARELIDETGGNTLAFLSTLNHRLYERTRIILREEGDPYPPLRTFDERCGACRDVTELFADACRVAGVACRFVSGYQEGDPDTSDRHLHGWAEVYLPGAGWRGFDPTHGLAVADAHIAVAAAARPADAAPVTGTFRGTDATATMAYDLKLTVER